MKKKETQVVRVSVGPDTTVEIWPVIGTEPLMSITNKGGVYETVVSEKSGRTVMVANTNQGESK